MARVSCRSLALALALLPTSAWAHPRDELEQASYIGIAPDAVTVELDLIPGDLVEEVFARETQRGDHAARVAAALRLSLDDIPLPLELLRTRPLPVGLRLYLHAPLSPLAAGRHTLRYENGYAPLRGGYLATALAGSERLTIGEQRRDERQRSVAIDFDVAADSLPRSVWVTGAIFVAGGIALWRRFVNRT
jgi:hypothetical protein